MSLQTARCVAACLPITALSVIKNENAHLLLSGQGYSLQVRDLISRKLLHNEQIFENQVIHGIRQIKILFDGDCHIFELLIWGGSLVAFANIKVRVRENGQNFASIEILEVVDAGDWILDSTTVSDPDVGAAILTAHNILHMITKSTSTTAKHEITVLGHGPLTFLYSGHVSMTRDDFFIVAAGTVFGEVLLWTCKKDFEGTIWNATPRYVFYGHRGSIFGVCVSDIIKHEGQNRRILASCSDDRTIMFWNITECEQDPPINSSIYPQCTITGFGENLTKEAHLATTWGHLSRIWGVHFISETFGESINHGWIVSRGEDGACQMWRLHYTSLFALKSNSNAIQALQSDRHHAGKNIWSLTLDPAGSDMTIFSGGADGQIVSRTFYEGAQLRDVLISTPFRNIKTGMQPTSDALERCAKFKAFKSYLIVDSSRLLVATDSGALLEGSMSDKVIDWQFVAQSPNQSLLNLSTNSSCGYAFFTDSYDNAIYVYKVGKGQPLRCPMSLNSPAEKLQVARCSMEGQRANASICLVVSFRNSDELQVLWLTVQGNSIDAAQTSIPLPETFVVSSCFYDHCSKLLILGSRSGAVAAYRNVDIGTKTAHATLCERHIHQSDTVTGIIGLPTVATTEDAGYTESYVLTTGRDGFYAILRISEMQCSGEERNLRYDVVHRGTVPLGPNIEGATLIGDTNNPSLVLYGFRSKDFVAWDETNQVQLFNIDCGGAHRSWDFQMHNLPSIQGTFVWTKAGSFNLQTKILSDHQTVEYGGHGREIKAVAVYDIDEQDVLVATGAEDTDIRLFKYHKNSDDECSSFRTLTVLKRHTTGLQSLRFSSCGNYLLSAGGMEELYLWKLHKVPILEIGVTFVDEIPHIEELSDARIMSIDVSSEHQNEGANLTLVAAYSNGKLKTIRKTITKSSESPFTYQAEVDFGALCLTQVALLPAVDGREHLTVVGATNGFLSIYSRPKGLLQESEFRGCHKIHQSSISALAVANLGTILSLALTGGDDNALGITLISTDFFASKHVSFRTIIIPKAHAAALTAVSIVRQASVGRKYQILLSTAGNDQKVKLWSIEIDEDKSSSREMQDIQVESLNEFWTSVADVSGMEVLSRPVLKLSQDSDTEEAERVQILVVGVGMQVLSLNLKM